MIPDKEYVERRTRLKTLLRESNAACFVATSNESIYYLCGATYDALERPFFFLIPAEGNPQLVVPFLEKDHLKKARAIRPEWIDTYSEYPALADRSWETVLRRHCSSYRAFLYDGTTPSSIGAVLDEMGGRYSDLVEQLRLVKSTAEVAMIRRAAHYADAAVHELLRHSYYGSTVAEGFARTGTVTQKIVREIPAWDPLATKVILVSYPAPQSAMPHSVPHAAAELREGPHVALALTRVNGYAAESERTYFTSPPLPRDRELFKLMLAARRIGLGMLKPGTPCADIDASVNHFLAKEGFVAEQRLHRIGHGFGLGNHEGPWIAEGSHHVLQAGMVVSIEPGIYVQEVGGYRHSDTILVTRDGYEMLTKAPGIDEPLVLQRRTMRNRIHGYFVSKALGLDRRHDERA